MKTVSCVATVLYSEYLRPRAFAFGHHPAHPYTMPYREFGSLTALGYALLALNTVLWLPDNIFQAVCLGFVACPNCSIFCTVHAHLAHRPDNRCGDLGPRDSSFIAVTADTVAQIGPNGKRTSLTVPEV
jgi:hypothetical protein